MAVLVVVALLAAACSGADEDLEGTIGEPTTTRTTTTPTPGTDPTEGPGEESDPAGGTVVWGFDQEPRVLNPTLRDGNLYVNTQIALATMLPLWVITPDFTYEPTVLLEDAEVSDTDEGFSVRYTLNAEAAWSDGTPISAGDVFFTLETCLDEDWTITTRAGCDRVDMTATAAGLEADSSVIEVVFTEDYAAWQTLFSTADGIILPSHLLEGENWNSVWNDEIPIASGPFQFESWDRGRQLTLVRNDTYAGGRADLERIVLRFLPDAAAQVEQLRAGEIDLVDLPPQIDLVQQVQVIDDVAVQTVAGPVWEHLDFQHTRPPLDERSVRLAMAMAIDRAAIVEELIVPVHPEAEPLGSIVYLPNQDTYVDHLSEVVEHDPEGAVALLEENGCERDDDEIFLCEGERMAFELTTGAGDERRELTVAMLTEQLAAVGIELEAAFGAPTVVFGDSVLGAGNYDLIAFSWVGSPDPESNVEAYACQGERNTTGHCDEQASELLVASNTTTDPAERARLMNRAGQRLAEAVAILPLYQLPVLLAYDTDTLMGPQVNPTLWGPVWNVASWSAPAS